MSKLQYISILVLLPQLLFSQLMPTTKQYLINNNSYIPAFAGQNGNIESFISYKMSWLGIEGAPKTMFFNLNGAMTENMGLSFVFANEQHGNFSTTHIIPAYAFHIRFSDQVTMSLALSPFFSRTQINLSKVVSHGNTVDPYLSNINGLFSNYIDVGASLVLNAFDFNLGVYLPKSLAYSSAFGSALGIKNQRQINTLLSYSLKVSNFVIEPKSTLVYMPNEPIGYSFNVITRYKNRVFGGLGYNSEGSLDFSIGFVSTNNIVMKYNYQAGFGTLARNSIGTHEVCMGFLIKPAKKFKTVATIFSPTEETDTKPIDNNKLAALEKNLEKEKQERIKKDADLQRQIDSLKQLKFSNVANQIPSQVVYVQKIVTYSVVFGFMNANILPSSYSELEKFYSKMQQDPNLRMKIVVYTDNLFNDAVNKQISQMRAKALYDYISRQPNVIAQNIEYVGMGSADPIADNTTPEGREKNNRVEFLFSKTVF